MPITYLPDAVLWILAKIQPIEGVKRRDQVQTVLGEVADIWAESTRDKHDEHKLKSTGARVRARMQ